MGDATMKETKPEQTAEYAWINPITHQRETADTREEALLRVWKQIEEFNRHYAGSKYMHYLEITKLTPFPHRGFWVYWLSDFNS